MRRILSLVGARHVVPILLIVLAAAPAAARPAPPKPAASKRPHARVKPAVVVAPIRGNNIMPVAQVRPGMIAVGKSVFHGTTIESFHLKILGVLPRERMGSDVILARVLDGVLIERQSAVLQGMSGSPVYINGRLIGAISFSWPFAKEPICGITAIEDMLKVLASQSCGLAPVKPPSPVTGAVSLAQPVVVGGRAVDRVRILAPGAAQAGAARTTEAPGTITLQPMSCLLQVSGMPERAMDSLRDLVAPFGAAVTQGLGGSGKFSGGDLRPGASLGVQLVSGDFDVTAVGTVTYTAGNRLLAFGHPMMSIGETDLPATTAYIHTIVPSYLSGMKLGMAGRAVGRISTDEAWAIAGITGEQADTIPMEVTVTDPARMCNQTFHARMARHRQMAPGLAGTIVLSAIDRGWQHVGEGTAHISVEVEGDGYAIRRTDASFSVADAAAPVISEVATPISLMMRNEFGSVKIKAVRARIDLTNERKTARIENVSVQPGKIKAGESLDVRVRLRPFKGEPVEKHLRVKLPPDLPDGTLRLGVAGGNDADQLRPMLGLMRRRPFNLAQLVDIYQTAERADEIVALLALPGSGASLQGRRVPSLPGYLLDVLADARSSMIEPARDYVKASLISDWIVEGRQVISIEIEGKPGAKRGPGPSVRPTPPPKEEPAEEGGPPVVEEAPEMAGTPAAAAPVAAATTPETAADRQPKPAKKEEKAPAEPIGREPSLWTQAKRADFLPGEFRGIACDEDGVLSLAPGQKTIAKLDEPIVSALLAQGGAIYVAAGPGGRVRKLSSTGEVLQTWDTGAALVTAIGAGPPGQVLVGASPGDIRALDDNGGMQMPIVTHEDTAWCFARGPAGEVYVGTGPHGKIFRIDPTGGATLFAQLPATNVYALAIAKDTIYAGTGNAGALYAVGLDGQVRVAYDSDQEAIASLAADADGVVYAGTAPKAAIIRLRPGQDAEPIARFEGDVVAALVAGPSGLLYAVTAEDGIVYQVDPKSKQTTLLRKPEHTRAIALGIDGGALIVGESNPAAVVRLGPEHAERGVFTSKPQQAQPGAHWGALSGGVERPAGASASFETRSGESPDPDDHWSEWSAPTDLDSAADVVSPPAGFLQYRITLSAAQPGVTPQVRDLQVSYLPPNREPTITISEPKPAARLRQTVQIKWKGTDADKDKLVYDVAVSADNGRTWKDLKTDIEGDSYSWDTTEDKDKTKDGAYLLRVTASDRRSNPSSPRQDDGRFLVWVDNTPPELVVLRHTLQVDDKGNLRVSGNASDALSPVQGVDYRVDDGTWRAAVIDGVAGRLRASFSIETSPLTAGGHRLEVRAFDQAGNSAVAKAPVTVKAAPQKQ